MQDSVLLNDSGVIAGGVHRLPLRVWFEDTDLTGIVYHANYLRYMERARSAMLEVAGIDQRDIRAAGGGYYAVAELRIAYRRPARLGDRLSVASRVTRVRAAATEIAQDVMRGDETLTEASVTAAWLDAKGRPQRQPRAWTERFTALMHEAA